MLSTKNAVAFLAVGCLLLGSACSDDNGTSDGKLPVQEAGADGPVVDGGKKFWPCDKPGAPCNAHDTCAINPICGQDKLCRADNYQNCDDGLDCTEDICARLGVCENKPKAGFCALRVKVAGQTVIKCFANEAIDPADECQWCEAAAPLVWSPRNGGGCSDGNACTKDDYCQNGLCRGTDYAKDCSDSISCTTDCDGNGGCLAIKPIAKDFCQIGGKCYAAGAKNPANCSTCEPSKSQTAWTPTSMTCLINGKCYNPGDKHGGGCAECDPVANVKGWTVKTTTDCLIGNICKKLGDQDAIKCGECKPSASKYAWTPISGKCKIFGKCYSVGEKNSGGCAECDPPTNATAWTVKGTADCLISNTCKKANDLDATGCLSCQPASGKYDWSAVSGKCQIDGKCYGNGDKDSSGCLTCNFSATPKYWSVAGGVSSTGSNFDGASALPSGWSAKVLGPTTSAKWQIVSGKQSFSGSNALYYGDAAKGNYDVGANGGEASLTGVVITAGKKATLVFKAWLDVDPAVQADTLKIYACVTSACQAIPVPSSKIWDKSKISAAKYKTWEQQEVDLSAYAGQTITLRFEFIAYGPDKNTGAGIYLDDVHVVHGC